MRRNRRQGKSPSDPNGRHPSGCLQMMAHFGAKESKMLIPMEVQNIVKTPDIHLSPEQNLLNVLEEIGMPHNLSHIIADGQFHRFPILCPGRKTNNDHGYYKLDPTSGCGVVGDWKGEYPQTIIRPSGPESTLADRVEHTMAALAAAEEARENQEKLYAKAALECRELWESLEPADRDHPYLRRKKLNCPYGARSHKEALAIAYMDTENRITSLQFILPDGSKRYAKGSKVKGSFALIGEGEPEFLTEGFATGASVYQTTGRTTLVAGSAGNLEPVAAHFPKVTVVADNDEAGVAAAKKCHEEHGNPYIIVPSLRDGDTDANDFMVAGGDLSALLKVPPRKRLFMTLNEIVSHPRPVGWIVYGLIPEGPSTAMIFGPSGKCKTFVSLDIALSSVCGLPSWFGGLKVHRKKVLYLVGEGLQSIQERIICWLQQHGIAEDEITNNFVLSPYNFPIDSPEALNRTLEQLRSELGDYRFGLVLIDTMNLFMEGDENATVDANRFIAAIKTLAAEYNCCVLIIHHTGVDKDYRARGNSAFKGALDSEIQVTRRDDDGLITVTQTKNRASEAVPQIVLQLEKHGIVGLIDEDTGELKENAILVQAEPAEDEPEVKPLTHEQVFLVEACKNYGEKNPDEGTVSISRNALIRYGNKVWTDKDNSEVKRELNPNQKYRTLGKLLGNGTLRETSVDIYMVCDDRILQMILSPLSEDSDEEIYAGDGTAA